MASESVEVGEMVRVTSHADPVRYPRVRRLVSETPWAILPAKLAAIVGALDTLANGGTLTPQRMRAEIGAAAPRAPGERFGAVAVIPVVGVLSQRADLLTESSGGTSTDRLARQVRDAAADATVSHIVLDIDSPGGSVFGIEEAADAIREANARKPVTAIANSLAASAGYWLATAAGELVVSPGGQVGSIGVITAHEDFSELDARLGVKTTLISAGKYKTEANPFEPLGEEARDHLQSLVDGYYGTFVRDVARFRRVPVEQVRGGFGEGRLVQAKDALALGMVDSIGSFDATIRRLTSGRNQSAPQRALGPEPPWELVSGLENRKRRQRLAEAGG